MTDASLIEDLTLLFERLGPEAAEGLTQEIFRLGESLAVDAPQNDDELWDWIKKETGYEIPRVAVCEGHTSPFEFLADLYFRRTTSAIGIGNRGGSKTFLVAMLHYLNARTRRGIEAATVGATEAQGQRCYAHLKKLIGPHEKALTLSMIQSKTIFKSLAVVEVLPGTPAAVNGPHPHVVHADEVELMNPETFAESRNMSQSGFIDGQEVPAQDIITSTRKYGQGQMQKLLDEVAAARLQDREVPYDIYTWCIFEVAQGVENCACARPDLPPAEQCRCHQVVKGEWEETGTPRTLKDVCGGRLYRSRGFLPWEHVKKKFMDNARSVWEAQQTCEKPSLEGLVFPMFNLDRHALIRFDPDPANGPIYKGIDFGGSNPHAVLWIQQLRVEVEARSYSGQTIRLKEGSRVVFSEIYKAEIGNSELARQILGRDALWRDKYPDWRVSARFADPQAKAARLDLNDAGLPCVWYGATRDIKEQVKKVVELFEDDRLFIDSRRCPMTIEEIQSYHYPKKRAGYTDDPEVPVDDFNHAMSALRYCVINLEMLGRKRTRTAPGVGGGRYATNDGESIRTDSMPSIVGPTVGMPSDESWRKQFNMGPAPGGSTWRP